MTTNYQGQMIKPGSDVLELHYCDDDGPIFVHLPREGLERMCGQSLSDDDVRLIVQRYAETELFELIDQAVERSGGFTDAFFGNGVPFRKLDVTMEDIETSKLKLSTQVLAVAAASGFVDAQTGRITR